MFFKGKTGLKVMSRDPEESKIIRVTFLKEEMMLKGL